jgi:hypothetical protein
MANHLRHAHERTPFEPQTREFFSDPWPEGWAFGYTSGRQGRLPEVVADKRNGWPREITGQDGRPFEAVKQGLRIPLGGTHVGSEAVGEVRHAQPRPAPSSSPPGSRPVGTQPQRALARRCSAQCRRRAAVHWSSRVRTSIVPTNLIPLVDCDIILRASSECPTSSKSAVASTPGPPCARGSAR